MMTAAIIKGQSLRGADGPFIPKTLILRFTLVCRKAASSKGSPGSAVSPFTIHVHASMHAALLGHLLEPTEFILLITWAVTIACRQHGGTNTTMLLPCTHTVCCFFEEHAGVNSDICCYFLKAALWR